MTLNNLSKSDIQEGIFLLTVAKHIKFVQHDANQTIHSGERSKVLLHRLVLVHQRGSKLCEACR